jgi:MFS family permease
MGEAPAEPLSYYKEMVSKRCRCDEEEELLVGSNKELRFERHAGDSRAWAEETDIQISKNGRDEEATWQNLPHKKQLLLIALCRLSAPLTNTCLIPYLFFLVKSVVSEPEQPTAPQHISRLTGLLVAAFPIGQMLTSILWGRLSDSYGRKSAIILGLGMSVVANVAFGFSRTFGMLMVWRVIAGMANGTEGVMRTMTAEIVKEQKHQPRAFLAPPVIFNSGRVIALAVGGCLANPVDNLPHLFGPEGAFNMGKHPAGVKWTLHYPYALPAFFNAIVLGACLSVAAIWLRESLPAESSLSKSGFVTAWTKYCKSKIFQQPSVRYTVIQDKDESLGEVVSFMEASSSSSGPNLRVPSIWTRQVYHALITFALLPLHNATFLHIFPLMLSMPIVYDQKLSVFLFKGGLGLVSPTIGLYLALFGIAGIMIQLFLYPWLHQRVGTVGMFRIASSLFPIAYIAAPYLVFSANQGFIKWVAMASILFIQVMARTMAIPSSILLLTDSVPSRNVMGTIHGAGNTVSAMASACGPAIGGVLLAEGINMGAIGLVWWTWICAISIVAFGCSCFMLREKSDVASLGSQTLKSLS